MAFAIRNERPGDELAIRKVVEQAFGQSTEADLIDALRRSRALSLSLVAELNDEIAGHVAFSDVTIVSPHATQDAVGLAPLAVLPARQQRGIGAALMQRGLEECRALGHKIVIVLGDPLYYSRFGFERASNHGIDCPYQVPPEAFMVAELVPGALAGYRGVVRYRPEFDAVST